MAASFFLCPHCRRLGKQEKVETSTEVTFEKVKFSWLDGIKSVCYRARGKKCSNASCRREFESIELLKNDFVAIISELSSEQSKAKNLERKLKSSENELRRVKEQLKLLAGSADELSEGIVIERLTDDNESVFTLNLINILHDAEVKI